MARVSARSNTILGSKGLKNPQKGPFHWILDQYKKLNIFDFTTTYAILMKLTRYIS